MRRLFLLAALLVFFFGSAVSSTPVHAVQADPHAVPIVVYHHIANHRGLWFVGPKRLDAELEYLRDNGYHTISMATYMDAREKGIALPDKPIVLTFDDGYRDAYLNAFPLLKKYGMT